MRSLTRVRFFILPFDIPGKYYPLFLACLFGFLRGSFLDLWCAVGVGYAYADVSLAWGCLDDRFVTHSVARSCVHAGLMSLVLIQQQETLYGTDVGTVGWLSLVAVSSANGVAGVDVSQKSAGSYLVIMEEASKILCLRAAVASGVMFPFWQGVSGHSPQFRTPRSNG